MSDKQMDRRVRKTRAALRHALTAQMLIKPVQEITVRELSDLCDINRGTFYIHYRDVFDMVTKVENEMMQEFNDVLDEYPSIEAQENPSQFMTRIFEFLEANADMGSALLGPHGDIHFVNQLKAMVHKRFLNMWLDREPDNSKLSEYYASFIISGFVGLFEVWLQRGMSTSPQEMARIAENMILGSMSVHTMGSSI